eukprot:jgi/Botrbrau1/20374/Bobra.0006s0037.1
MLAFDPAERPTSEEALADPYFTGLSQITREPSAQPVSKLAFEFERKKLTTDEVRELIYREILEYHPGVLADYLQGPKQQPTFMYPSALDNFKKQWAHLEGGGTRSGISGNAGLNQATSLPKERAPDYRTEGMLYAHSHAHKQTSRAVDSIGSSVSRMTMVEPSPYCAPAMPPPHDARMTPNLPRSNSYGA